MARVAKSAADDTEVFDPETLGHRRRCVFCDLYPELVDWLSRGLKATHDGGHPRPAVRALCNHTNKRWSISRSENAFAKHLSRHEPNWKLWDKDAQ